MTPRGDPSCVPALGPKLRNLSADSSARSQETNTAPDSVVTPTSRSNRLGKRGCERVKSTPRHPSPVAVLCSATRAIIDGASGLFKAKRRGPSALCIRPHKESGHGPREWAAWEVFQGRVGVRWGAPKQVDGVAMARALLRDDVASQFAAPDVKSSAKRPKRLDKRSSCSSRRRAYLTLSPVLPSIVIKQCGGLAAFRFCVRVYQSFLSIRGAIRASFVWCLWDSRGNENR